jgi:hypothetical protein
VKNLQDKGLVELDRFKRRVIRSYAMRRISYETQQSILYHVQTIRRLIKEATDEQQ